MARAKIAVASPGLFYGVKIQCPGCGPKIINTDWMPPGYERYQWHTGAHVWKFDGNLERPTFTPSLLWKTGHYCSDGPAAADCMECKYSAQHNVDTMCMICHSWVRDGRIQFLPDCTHRYAGQTVDLPEID